MEPYYADESVTIYHADCADVLLHLELACLVCTDPPYGIGEAAGRNKSRSKLAVSKDYGDDTWDNAPPSDELIQAVVQAGRHAIVFGGNYFDLPPSSCWLVWDKENGASDFADAELAWTNLPGAVRLLRYRWAGMLQGNMGARKEFRVHPTQKPLPVMKWAISRAPDDVQVVLDPFMGSGTTLRAAKDLGKRAIGIEREERYCEESALRMSQGVLF